MRPPLPLRRMDLPGGGGWQRDTPARVLVGLRALPTTSPPILKTSGWKLHSRALSPLRQAATTPRRADSWFSPGAHRPRHRLPWGAGSRVGTLNRAPESCGYCVEGFVCPREGTSSRGQQAGAAPPWWQGGYVVQQPALRWCFKGSASSSPGRPQKGLRPHVQPAAPVDENPLEGMNMFWVHPPRADRIGVRQLTRARGGDGAWSRGCGLGQVGSGLRRYAGLRCGGRGGEKETWPAAGIAGQGGGRGRADRHAGLGAPLPPAPWRGGGSDSSCGDGAGGASFAESAGPSCGQ